MLIGQLALVSAAIFSGSRPCTSTGRASGSPGLDDRALLQQWKALQGLAERAWSQRSSAALGSCWNRCPEGAFLRYEYE
jgi:hypothetical protein